MCHFWANISFIIFIYFKWCQQYFRDPSGGRAPNSLLNPCEAIWVTFDYLIICSLNLNVSWCIPDKYRSRKYVITSVLWGWCGNTTGSNLYLCKYMRTSFWNISVLLCSLGVASRRASGAKVCAKSNMQIPPLWQPLRKWGYLACAK